MIDSITGYLVLERFIKEKGVITVPFGKGCYLNYSFKTTPNFLLAEEVTTVYLHTIFDDKLGNILYGFTNWQTREMFGKLLTVDGVGVKLALTVLNGFDDGLLIETIKNGNKKRLMMVKGIGAKVADKIIDKLLINK